MRLHGGPRLHHGVRHGGAAVRAGRAARAGITFLWRSSGRRFFGLHGSRRRRKGKARLNLTVWVAARFQAWKAAPMGHPTIARRRAPCLDGRRVLDLWVNLPLLPVLPRLRMVLGRMRAPAGAQSMRPSLTMPWRLSCREVDLS